MKIKKSNDITIYYREDKYLKILNSLENLKIEKVFKDDNRSKVSLFTFEQEKLVFKVPREKNNRKWQRFLSIFRGSESYREFMQAEKIDKAGLLTYKPILAFEKRKYGFIVDSYFICEYLSGETGSIKHLEAVKNELDKIHGSGYLHGDSQLVNFIIDNKHVYIIDSKFSKNKYGKFGARYEYIYLEESCPKKIEYEKNDIYYRGAKGLNDLLHWWGRARKKLKGKK